MHVDVRMFDDVVLCLHYMYIGICILNCYLKKQNCKHMIMFHSIKTLFKLIITIKQSANIYIIQANAQRIIAYAMKSSYKI